MSNQVNHHVRAVVREFAVPPIHDALVLGRRSPIGCVAMRKAVDLLTASRFEHIELEDETISDILVRTQILRRLPVEALKEFVLKEVKPLMGDEEILHIDLDPEVFLQYRT